MKTSIHKATFLTFFIFIIFILQQSQAAAAFTHPETTAEQNAKEREDSLMAVINRFSETISSSDIETIRGDLSPSFSIHISSLPRSERYLERILKSNTFQSVQYLSSHPVSEDTLFVHALFERQNGEKEEGIIAVDKQNRLLFVDPFERLYTAGYFGESVLKEVVPFSMENGSIVISLKLNEHDKPLRFLFDTGADGMAIRKTLADSIGIAASSRQEASVVGDRFEVAISSGNTVHLNESFSLKNQNMALFEQMGQGLDGIIGLNLCYEHIVNVNFDTRQLTFYSFGDHAFEPGGVTLDVSIPDGIMRVPCAINIVGKKEVLGEFVVDTGAGYHAIAFEQFVRKNRLLLTGFKSEDQASTVSLGVVTPVFIGKTAVFRINDKVERFNMPIVLQASGGSNNRDKNAPDGSIGIHLLSQFNLTIDMLRKKIHLKPSNHSN